MARLLLRVISLILVETAHALHTSRCSLPLGMASGEIRDFQVSSSSHFDTAVRAVHGRANKELGGGAWCPRAMVFDEGVEYLEINLLSIHIITKVEVQGRFGNGQGKEFAEHYKIQYWRPSINYWVTYKNGQGNELLKGNENTYLMATTELHPAITVTRVRIVPFSAHPRTVCMRVELYGCKGRDGLVSYSTEDGSDSVHGMRDQTYDGERRGDMLVGGLGELSDGDTGNTNYRVDAHDEGQGYEWVGWRNESRNGGPVEITFHFDSIRNFSAVHINVNNYFTRQVQVFSKAIVHFSIGGKYFSKSIMSKYLADLVSESARNVTIALQHLPADTVKLELYFASTWIMLSEVTFDSVKCDCGVPPEASLPGDSRTESSVMASVPVNTSTSNVIVISCVTFGIFVLTLALVAAAYFYKQRLRSKAESPLKKRLNKGASALNMNDLNSVSNSNSSARSTTRFYPDAYTDEESSVLYQEPFSVNNPGYLTLADKSLLQQPAVTGRGDSSDYAVPATPSILDIYKIPPPPPPPPQVIRPTTSVLADIVAPRDPFDEADHQGPFGVDIRGLVGSALFAMPESETLRSEVSLNEIKRSDIQFLDKIGESCFGVVHLCSDTRRDNSNNLLVIKSLKHNVCEIDKVEFKNELRIYKHLDDANISRLLGVISSDPLSAVFEYAEYGDLYQFLRFHDEHNTTSNCTIKSNERTLSYGGLLCIASQIASGMKYLEAKHLVHRDLAARNCLIGKNLRVKISDFAVTRNLYSSDYWNIEGRLLLPVRWMPPESILHAKFTAKSDVWSFGVTLWEILTLAKERPFDELSDAAAVEHICRTSCQSEACNLLPQPAITCREVYQMMLSCWRTVEKQRPPFWEILLFLQRKNLGYSLDYHDE